MSILRIFLVCFTLFLSVCLLSGQSSSTLADTVPDPDKVFFLERYFKSFGKDEKADLTLPNSGLIWHISTGVLNNSDRFMAAAIPLSVELGWKIYFIEIGVRHWRTDLVLGADSNSDFVFGSFAPGFKGGYTLPKLTGYRNTSGVITGHLKLKSISLFAKYAYGVTLTPSRGRSIVQVIPENGKPFYSTGTLFPVVEIPDKRITKSYSFGANYKYFFAGAEFIRLRQGSSSGSSDFTNMFIGLQMSPRKSAMDEFLPENSADARTVRIGVSRMITTAPWRKAGSSTGMTADLSVRMKDHWWMNLSWQFNRRSKGQDKEIQVDNFNDLGGPNSADGNRIYLGPSYLVQTEKPLQYYLTGGASLFTSELRGNKEAGIFTGVGVRYHWLRSALIYNVPFESVKPTLEWNLGADLIF